MSGDYCDLCDLPLSTCVHGMPAPPPPPAPAPRTPRATRSASTSRVAASSRASSTSRAAAAAPVRRAPRRWHAPEQLRAHVLAVLQEAGGELDQDDVFAAMEARLDGVLLEGDRGRTPEGELRWQYAARRARQALVAEGLMDRGRPGVWELTAAGMAEPVD